MPEVVTQTATPAETLQAPVTLASLVQAAIAAPSGVARDEACVAFSAHVRCEGLMSLFHPEDSLERIVTLTNSTGKAGAADRETAALLFLELTRTLEQAVEPLLVQKIVPSIMGLLADKDRKVQKAAEMGLDAFFDAVSTHSFANILPLLTNTDSKWQTLEYQMNTLSEMAVHKMATQVALALPTLIPVVSQLMWHDKAQVKQAATSAMHSISNTMTNRDLQPFIPALINTVLNPESVESCLEQLSSKIFVAEVRADALGVITPVLLKGLLPYRSTATKRQCAKIIDNMSKLVPDVREVAPFLPSLLPALERAKDEVANPECREVCTKVHERLMRAAKDVEEQARTRVDLTNDAVVGMLALPSDAPQNNVAAKYIAGLVLSLAQQGMEDSEEWHRVLTPYMRSLRPHLPPSAPSKPGDNVVEVLDADVASDMVTDLFDHVRKVVCPSSTSAGDAEETGELLCDCTFSLAYGSKILLNNAQLKLVRGARYGLCGQNDCGKTSLMRAISRNQVEGFPDPSKVRTVFVETDIQGELSNLSVLEYIFADPLLRDCGVTREEMATVLMSVGFEREGPASIDKEVGRLSGGWKMKLALARAMLLKADILLLDEPTNHLDVKNRQWVESYLQGLTNVTSIMVSHDSGFLDRVCTHILHIDNLKVKAYSGNLSSFVKQVPEAQAYFELRESKFRFKFPVPGILEGVTSKGKHIMKMSNVTFTYPGAAAPQLTNINVRVSLSSRVACVGPNGAGKSTMIKLLTGELVPDEGHGAEVWKHQNCRVAYVAQHAFHHIENHLDKTPNEYIRWRYQYGVDKEALQKSNMIVTAEELERQKTVIAVQIADAEGNLKTEKRVVKDLTGGRRQEHKGKKNEYEVLLHGGFDQKVWLPEGQLLTLGFEKAMKEVDERIAANVAGFARPLTADFVEQHILDVGLEREFATHTRIKALSGGQKVKVVLAAALWKCPHIIIIDEPTNYLDRESLGALAGAIKEFEGGVVIVSHNNEFCNACCPETWVLENHTLNVKGDPEWLANAEKEKVKAVAEEEESRDAFGNTIKRLKKASKQDMKKLRKKIDQMRKDGEEVWTDEELEKMGFDPKP